MMEVKKAVKRIAAVGVGASMLGATMLGAMAADLSDYPKPMFIGTPTPANVPKLEKPLGHPRPPFYVPKGTVLLSAEKPVILCFWGRHNFLLSSAGIGVIFPFSCPKINEYIYNNRFREENHEGINQ